MKRFRTTRAGFTLIEMLAAMAVLAIMVTLLFSAFNQASRAWLQSENRVETFQNARALLDLLQRELSQAVANSNITFYGSCDSIAFVAPVSPNPTNQPDLMEVCYVPNSWIAGQICGTIRPPFQVIKRATPVVRPDGSSDPNWDVLPGGASPWNMNDWPSSFTYSNAVIDYAVRVRYTYYDNTGATHQYWLSAVPTSSPWHEVGGGINDAEAPGSRAVMANRPPAGVMIELYLIDARTTNRLSGTTYPLSASDIRIVNQSLQSFSTFVAIPNGQQ